MFFKDALLKQTKGKVSIFVFYDPNAFTAITNQRNKKPEAP